MAMASELHAAAVGPLHEFLGRLQAAAGVDAQALRDARRDAQQAAVATPAKRVELRRLPQIAADPFAPAWTQAMRPSASRGPFLDEFGQPYWIDTFLLPALVSVFAPATPGGAPRLIARLPLSRRRTLPGPRRLAAGSVWLASRLLVPGRGADEFVGLAVRGGSLSLGPVVAATPDSITLGDDWQLGLGLLPQAPDAVTPAAGPGADATQVELELPARLELRLGRAVAPEVDWTTLRTRAYGSELRLAREAAPPFVDALSNRLVLPAIPEAPRLDLAGASSEVWQADGGPLEAAGWALPLAVAPPEGLGEAAGAGAAWLRFAGTQTARWRGLTRPARLARSVLALAPGSITLWGTVAPEAVVHTLRLWDETDPDPPRESQLEVRSRAGSSVLYASVPGAESVLFAGRLVGHLDRPLQADGGRVALALPDGWFAFVQTATELRAAVLGTDAQAVQAPHLAFALRNAFAKARPPGFVFAGGVLEEDRLVSGQLVLRMALRTLLPTLPDPYAANFDFERRQDSDRGVLVARVDWPDVATPVLGFALEGIQIAAPLDVGFAATRGPRLPFGHVLLDVSSRHDQFGVVIPAGAASVAVQGLDIVARGDQVGVVTLPPISWEPMLTKAPQGGGDIPLPPPPHDGGPAILGAEAPELLPLEPSALLKTFHAAIGQGRHFSARLPLPFGLIAQLQTRRGAAEGERATLLADGGQVFINRPRFDGDLEGATQWAVRGRPSPGDNEPAPGPFMDPLLPGYLEFADSAAENRYAEGVLSQNIHTRLSGDFGLAAEGAGLPLRRYELSGYGASLFSLWRDTQSAGPAIVKAQFDVIVGRTALEVIQMQSVLHPWHVRVVRTITIERQAGGWMLREDSGWVAASRGFFEYTAPADTFTPARRHPGAILGVEDVRRIELVGAQFDLPARPGSPDPTPSTWQEVRFDADVLFAAGPAPRLVLAGGTAGGRCPTRGATGWILIGGPKDGGAPPRVAPASAAQVFDLLSVRGAAQAPLECSVLLGGTAAEPGLSYRVARVEVGCNGDTLQPHLVAALRGAPLLPRDGAWSLARIAAADPAPVALAAGFPVPLVQPNAGAAGHGRWHLADPQDITRLGDADTPALRYALVQSLGTQKLLFPRPRVGNDPEPVTLPQPPQLADMGALLHAAGVFPGLAEAFDFKLLKSLGVSGGAFGFQESFVIGTPGAPRRGVLADLGGAAALRVLVVYEDENGQPTRATVRVDPAGSPRWSIELSRVCFAVEFKGAPLIGLFASVVADEQHAPKVRELRVRYEGFLNALQFLFSSIQQLGRFLPGGAGAALRVGFSQGHLTVRESFALPNLPLGAGQITDVALELGLEVALAPFDARFIAGIGSSQKPFRWVVSPLAGTGVVQVGIGMKGLDVLVQAGLGLGLAIDLGIAAGSASVTLAIELNTGPDPFEVRGIVSARASVDVLRGLASCTITVAVGLGIIPPKELLLPPFLPPQLLPPPDHIPSLTLGLTASASVAIHLTVCWVIDVDWDGYWQFRQDITTPEIPIPV